MKDKVSCSILFLINALSWIEFDNIFASFNFKAIRKKEIIGEKELFS